MDKFFAEIQKPKKQSETSEPKTQAQGEPEKRALPRGVVLGKDGKPCRSCMSSASWLAMMKQEGKQKSPSSTTPAVQTTSVASASNDYDPPPTTLPSNCPPDVEQLGRSTWTFLHTLSAAYPPAASQTQQGEMKQFLTLFSRLYPCWHCAEDFQQWIGTKGNEPQLGGRQGLMRWMCEAHNEVNVKLGKRTFDCRAGSLEERWGSGPGDGRCG